MTGVLGKRKHRERRPEEDDHAAAFRRAFEAKFKPLDSSSNKVSKAGPSYEASKEDEGSEASSWEGFESQAEEDAKGLDKDSIVEVIEHGHALQLEPLSKAEARAFMNSKPPSETSLKHKPSTNTATNNDEDEDEKLNLKNDLALQRLINESHILDERNNKGLSLGHRQKLLDSRLQALGSKSSILEQQKMPMSHRKGIVAKATEREAKRRQEARESGIVLEKPTKPRKPTKDKMRVRGVGGPAVGKFKGGTLQLSKRDVAEIRGRPARAKTKSRSKR